MRKIDDKKNTGNRFISSVVIGAGTGFLAAVVLFAVFAAIIAAGKMSENLMIYLTVFSALTGAAAGSVTAAKRYKSKIMLIGMSVGTLMFLVTLIASAFNESSDILGRLTPVLFLTFLAGGIIGGFMTLKRKRHSRT